MKEKISRVHYLTNSLALFLVVIIAISFSSVHVYAASTVVIIQNKDNPDLVLRESIYVGETMDWDVSIDGTPSNTVSETSWRSSNSDVVSIVSPGIMTGRSRGNAVITGTYLPDDISGTANIRIKQQVNSVTFPQSSLTLDAKVSHQLNPTIAPANADDINNGLSWTSSNPSVATVNQSGKVTTIAKGTTTITATFTNVNRYGADSPVKATVADTCTVTVKTPVRAVDVSPNTITLTRGDKSTLNVTVGPPYADNRAVSFRSSNTNVVTVNGSGVVTAVRDGKATITATAQDGSGRSDSCSVIVKLNPAKITVGKTKKSGKNFKNTLKWKPISNATKYRIQRSNNINGPFSTIKTTSKSPFINTVKPRKAYYYRIVALSSTPGCESYSKVRQINSIQSPSNIRTAFKRVKKTKKKKAYHRITVRWNRVSGASGYVIYRRVDNGGYSKFKTIKGGKRTSYTDKSVEFGKRYYYKVTSYFTSGGQANQSMLSKSKSLYTIKFIWSVKNANSISSSFGYRTHPISGKRKHHDGIDIRCPKGTKVKAAAAGRVESVRFDGGGYGYYVVIRHGNGYKTLYAHNLKNLVKVGQSVKQGQIIARADSTGGSTGHHLHFEVKLNNKLVNPANYLQ